LLHLLVAEKVVTHYTAYREVTIAARFGNTNSRPTESAAEAMCRLAM